MTELKNQINSIERQIELLIAGDDTRQAIEELREKGLQKKLIGIELVDRGVPRAGYSILDEAGSVIGKITSGTFAPTLQKAIALAYVPIEFAKADTQLWMEARGRKLAAKVAKTPFYKRTKN